MTFGISLSKILQTQEPLFKGNRKKFNDFENLLSNHLLVSPSQQVNRRTEAQLLPEPSKRQSNRVSDKVFEFQRHSKKYSMLPEKQMQRLSQRSIEIQFRPEEIRPDV